MITSAQTINLSASERIHQRLFNALYSRSLLYNACWEDPALDRIAMRLGPNDTVMVITSAGCNALDYALMGPKRVHAVDANPRQTALLELKMAGIRHLSHQDFFSLFGRGYHKNIRNLYRTHLRQDLSYYSQQYWDSRLHWFLGYGWRNSFYFHGLSGLVARIAQQFLVISRSLRKSFDRLLQVTNLEDQQAIYDKEIEPKLWGAKMRWAVSRRSTMSLLGVPAAQARAVEQSHKDGIVGFIRDSIRTVFRELPIWTNYFWSVYLRGHYTKDCCPEYLKEDNFQMLKDGLIEKIIPHTNTVTQFLLEPGEKISRYVLLDHMDWMAHYMPVALAEEWQALINRSADNTRILFRSASEQPTFLNNIYLRENSSNTATALNERLQFDLTLAAALHQRDRVHTYASFHIADLVR